MNHYSNTASSRHQYDNVILGYNTVPIDKTCITNVPENLRKKSIILSVKAEYSEHKNSVKVSLIHKRYFLF